MDAERIAQLVTATAPAPPWWVVVTAALFAVLVAASNGVLAGINVLGVLVHEAAHALVSVATGGEVTRIELSSHNSGSTHGSDGSWGGEVLSSAAGYAAPPLAGVGAALMLDAGHAPGVLGVAVLVMLGVLPVARGLLTIGGVLGVGVFCTLVLLWGPMWLQMWAAYAVVCLLLASGIQGVLALVVVRVAGQVSDGDDAANLRGLTGVPEVVWIAGWGVLAGWCVWTGGGLLWP